MVGLVVEVGSVEVVKLDVAALGSHSNCPSSLMSNSYGSQHPGSNAVANAFLEQQGISINDIFFDNNER